MYKSRKVQEIEARFELSIERILWATDDVKALAHQLYVWPQTIYKWRRLYPRDGDSE